MSTVMRSDSPSIDVKQDAASEPLLSVRDLKLYFPTRDQGATVKAIDGVSFDVFAGETFGIIGESGSGKTTLGRALVSLLKPTAGTIRHAGTDLTALSAAQLRQERRHYQIVFQDPSAALNPRQTILDSVCEPLEIQGGLSRAEREQRALEALSRVGIAPGRLEGVLARHLLVRLGVRPCRGAHLCRRGAPLEDGRVVPIALAPSLPGGLLL
jgi:ABC-type glutathione transport system ATPase component